MLQANHFYQYVLNHELQQGHAYTVWRYELTRYGYGSRPSFWWIHNRLIVSSVLLLDMSLINQGILSMLFMIPPVMDPSGGDGPNYFIFMQFLAQILSHNVLVYTALMLPPLRNPGSATALPNIPAFF